MSSFATAKQKGILKTIYKFYQDEGYYPSIRQISQVLKTRSSNTIWSHLEALIRKGFLKKNIKGQIISITDSARKLLSSPTSTTDSVPTPLIPFFTSPVSAGHQQPASNQEPDLLSIDQYIIKNPSNTFALKVTGNSMEKAGIMPDDVLLVEKRQNAQSGDIVIAHLPTGFTVKRLLTRSGKSSLRAESSKKYLIPKEEGTEVWGVVIGCIRKY